MNSGTPTEAVVGSIEVAWPKNPVPGLKIFSYRIIEENKKVILKAFLEEEILAEAKDDVWDIEGEICCQLPDDWSVETLFLTPGASGFLAKEDTVVFRAGDRLTPRDRFDLRMVSRPPNASG